MSSQIIRGQNAQTEAKVISHGWTDVPLLSVRVRAKRLSGPTVFPSGMKVALAARDTEKLAGIQSETGAHLYACDTVGLIR